VVARCDDARKLDIIDAMDIVGPPLRLGHREIDFLHVRQAAASGATATTPTAGESARTTKDLLGTKDLQGEIAKYVA
jgi:hypothetical protein